MRKVFILSILSVVIVFGFAKRNYLNGRFKSGLTKPVNCKNCDIEFNEKNSIHIIASKKSSLHSPIKKEIGIRKYLKNKSLVPLKDGEGYIIDKMSYSYPFLTAKTISFIEALGMEFKTACELSHLRCRPFIITSALRTKETVNKLQKINPNALKESTHLYGCTFDITWSRFGYGNDPDQEMLDLLIPCLKNMQKKRKCRIKFEMNQSCFHITALQ
jgi:hypothetical protein